MFVLSYLIHGDTYSRKKKEDEMVPARQFDVNECKYITTALEGKLTKAKVEIVRVFEGK